MDHSLYSSELVPKGLCDGAQINNNFEKAIRNYEIDRMSNSEICLKLERESRWTSPIITAPKKDNEVIWLMTAPDLSIREVDPSIKDQICTFHFVFKFSTATLAGLFKLDEFTIKRIIREKRLIEKCAKPISKRGRKRILEPHHIRSIKNFVANHTRKYFNCKMI